jgi:hypothetical protein
MVSLQAQPTVEIRSEMDLTQAASFSRWVYTQLYSHKISDWGRFLALLGVEYLVVRLDADMPRERNDLSAFSLVNTLAALNVQKDFVLEQDFGSVLVYRNTYSLPIVYGADDFSALIGDRRMLLSLVNSHFDFSKHPAVFLDDAVNYAELLIKNSSCVVSQGDSYWSLIVASLGAEYTVAPWLYAPVSATPWGKWVSGDLMWSFWGGALNVAPDGFIYSEGMTNITIPLNVDTFGSYRVLAQVYDGTFAVGSNGLQFLSEGTGTINHVFCDYRYTEGIYRWVDLGVSYLDDRSELILFNLCGAAAVSKIAILPEEYVKDAAQNVHDLFEESDTGMTYIFDDFSWNYSLDGVVHNSLAGDGRMINLQKSSARTSFYIFKPENYALQARFSVSGESATIMLVRWCSQRS